MKTVEKSLVSMLPPLKTQHSGVSGRPNTLGDWDKNPNAGRERV